MLPALRHGFFVAKSHTVILDIIKSAIPRYTHQLNLTSEKVSREGDTISLRCLQPRDLLPRMYVINCIHHRCPTPLPTLSRHSESEHLFRQPIIKERYHFVVGWRLLLLQTSSAASCRTPVEFTFLSPALKKVGHAAPPTTMSPRFCTGGNAFQTVMSP